MSWYYNDCGCSDKKNCGCGCGCGKNYGCTVKETEYVGSQKNCNCGCGENCGNTNKKGCGCPLCCICGLFKCLCPYSDKKFCKQNNNTGCDKCIYR